MLGAIAGDVIGSVYEWNAVKTKDFRLLSPESFATDDSYLTLAVADALLGGRDYGKCILSYFQAYPGKGYGGGFCQWGEAGGGEPYNSWGNGSAMRVSPVGWAAQTLDEVLHEAEQSAACTHNHPEGIKGAQATALAIWLARNGSSKQDIGAEISRRFGYDLNRKLDDIRPDYRFDESCQGTVPESVISFLESTDYEDAVRNAVSLGGDADTLACITGGIAEAFYGGVPDEISEHVLGVLDTPCQAVFSQFSQRFLTPLH